MKKKIKKNNWAPPKNAAEFFDPHYDDDFKAAHPFLFFLTVVAIIILVVIPPIACLCIMAAIGADINSLVELIVLIFGLVSSMGISIGICNVFMILYKQYLGHYVTIFSLLIGFLGGGGSILIFWLMNK